MLFFILMDYKAEHTESHLLVNRGGCVALFNRNFCLLSSVKITGKN